MVEDSICFWAGVRSSVILYWGRGPSSSMAIFKRGDKYCFFFFFKFLIFNFFFPKLCHMDTFCCLTWKRDFSASYTCFVVEVVSLVLARHRRKFLREHWIFCTARRMPKQFCSFGGFKMVQYIHIFYTARPRQKQFCFLGGQNDAIYKNFGFFFLVKMLPYIHILSVFWVKMLPYIHILGVKMLPYIHISGI